MRLFFSTLSVVYIAGIFILTGSPLAINSTFLNPYSLLHIPLYGILTFLLTLSFMSLKFNPFNKINQINPRNPRNWRNYFLLSGGIALIIAIADEIHQVYVPGRDASINDVLLDMVGISLALFLFFRLLKSKYHYS